LRAQCDVDFATRLVSFEGLLRARERFRGLIDVEIVAFPQEGIGTDAKAPSLLREALVAGADAVGGLPEFERSVGDQERHIETVLGLAAEFDVPADLHTDYLDVPELRTLELLADRVLAGGFKGSVIAAHCCALALYPDGEAARVIEKVARAGIQVTIMPIANLEMLGGTDRTPRNRGSSRAKELLDAGVNVASALDNMYDIWYRFSRMDPVELASMTIHSCGMRTDAEVETAFDMVTTRAARVVGGSERQIEPGEAADLVLFEAASVVDVIRQLPGRRVSIKAGRVVGGIEGSCWAAA
jgi:cytosine deaminase